MLDFLSFQGVGPAPVLGPLALAPRFNFITGDNGLGKSFVLDAAWWVLTRTWATNRCLKGHRHAPLPTIDYQLTGSDQGVGQWALQQGHWSAVGNVPNNRALVVYAHADGAFSVWDPVRNDARLPAFEFTGKQVWRGAEHAQQGRLCNGLIDDWVRWQRMHGNLAFAAIKRMLRTLSPSREELLLPGKPCHIGLLDETEYPTLRRPQGVVPLTEASSAIRRVVALAYMLVWTWQGHRRACRQAGVAASTELVFLVDEVECHLHANWQRRIVPALMAVVAALTQQRLAVQMVVATHSPLVLASMESDFDTERDGLFTLFLEREQVQLAKQPWAPQGDVVNWLVSKSFGLRQARSLGAERAIDAAEAWMNGDPQRLPCTLDDCAEIHAELLRTLPAGDHFWPRWIVATRKEPS
jgi:hypothetical protein